MTAPPARLVLFALLASAPCACRSSTSEGSSSSQRPDRKESAERAPLELGGPAPSFSLLSQTGYGVPLETLLTEPVALYFCPAGLDSRCQALATGLRDQWLRLIPRLSMAAIVVPTGWNDNRSFSTEHELPLLLLSDRDGSVTARYRLPDQDANAPRGFLIDASGVVRRRYDHPARPEHVQALLDDLN